MAEGGEAERVESAASARRSHYRNLNDAALIAALRSDEPAAFVEFIERFRPMLSNYAARAGIDESERPGWVVELLHDVMLLLVNPTMRVPASLSGYLVRACRNKAHTARRANFRRTVRESEAALMEIDQDHPNSVHEKTNAEWEANGVPPALQRFAFALEALLGPDERELLDWSQELVPLRTIALWLGINRAAAAQRVWRLRDRLRKNAVSILGRFDPGDQAIIRRFLKRAKASSIVYPPHPEVSPERNLEVPDVD
jgi:DNA-directed RNA polymerase specialized sigma24 family protein